MIQMLLFTCFVTWTNRTISRSAFCDALCDCYAFQLISGWLNGVIIIMVLVPRKMGLNIKHCTPACIEIILILNSPVRRDRYVFCLIVLDMICISNVQGNVKHAADTNVRSAVL